MRESSGFAVAVDDPAILAARDEVARREGFSMCPEGAACFAAYQQEINTGRNHPHETCVIYNSASGVKYELPPQDAELDCTKPIDYAAL